MKILIADDAAAARMLISRFVESLGHQVVLARDGIEAIEMFCQHQPDMVLIDMLMPRMDGPDAAREIKALSTARWTPVVLITAVGEEDRLAEAIETGVDDYLLKPLNYRILEAKITAIQRSVELNRKVHDQSVKLAEYYDRTEEEKRVAQHLMEHLINRERLSDPQLEYWISPAESLSGDLIACARTPLGVMHLMLADGIGHGLTAALNVLPLTQPFYPMTELGFAMSDILLEMSRKVRQVLPIGRFIAITFVAVDFSEGYIEVWNAGIPDLHLVNRSGQRLKTWRSKHLPLGILPTEKLDLTTERFSFVAHTRLVVCSDGLLEARNRAHDNYGYKRLLEICGEAEQGAVIPAIVENLGGFLDGEACHDDVSVAVVHIDPQASTIRPITKSTGSIDIDLAELARPPAWQHLIRLGAAELRSVHTVPLLASFLSQIKPFCRSQGDVFLILTELFVNALDHGLLKLSSDLKRQPDGAERYVQERSQRLAELKDGQIEIELSGYDLGERTMLRVRVSDSGDGFDQDALTIPTTEQVSGKRAGKGIAVVRALCAQVRFSAGGSTVEAYYFSSNA